VLTVSGIDPGFYPAAWKVGLALGLSPSSAGYEVASILYSESSITPSVVNSIGCAGINQFCPGSMPTGITTAQYVQLTASQQLVGYVWPFWAARVRAVGGIDRAADLYWLNFYPATYKRGAPGSYVVDPNVGALDSGLSRGKTYVTVDDIQAFLDRIHTQSRWKAIKANLAPYAVPGLLAPVGGWKGLLAYGAVAVSLGAWAYLLHEPGARR
jgi:hypothetical protein